MKANAMMFAAVLLAASASPATAQSSGDVARKHPAAADRFGTSEVCRIEKNYVAALASENDGVVESAIAQSVRMKWALPSAQLEGMRESLGKLATDGRTPVIRYKAELAGLVYDAPSIFSAESGQNYTWDEDLFSSVSMRAQKALLGYYGDGSRGF